MSTVKKNVLKNFFIIYWSSFLSMDTSLSFFQEQSSRSDSNINNFYKSMQVITYSLTKLQPSLQNLNHFVFPLTEVTFYDMLSRLANQPKEKAKIV